MAANPYEEIVGGEEAEDIPGGEETEDMPGGPVPGDAPYVAASGFNGHGDFLYGDEDIYAHTFEEHAIADGRDHEDYVSVVAGDLIGPESEVGRYHDNDEALRYVLDRVERDDWEYLVGDNELRMMFPEVYGDDQYEEEHGEEPGAADRWWADIDDGLREVFLRHVTAGNISVVEEGYGGRVYMHGGTSDADDVSPYDAINRDMAEVADRLLRGQDAEDVYDDVLQDDTRALSPEYMDAAFYDLDPEAAQVTGNTTGQDLADQDGYADENPQAAGEAVAINTIDDSIAGHTGHISVSVDESADRFYAVSWDGDDTYRHGFNGADTDDDDGRGRPVGDGGIPIADTIDVTMNDGWQDKNLQYVEGSNAIVETGSALSKTWNLLKAFKGEGNYANSSFNEILNDIRGESSDLDFEYELMFDGDAVNLLEDNDYRLQMEITPGRETGHLGRDFRPRGPDSIKSLDNPVRFADLDWTPGALWGTGNDRVYDNPVDPADVFDHLDSIDASTYGIRARVVDDNGGQIAEDDGTPLITDWEAYDVETGDDFIDNWGPSDIVDRVPDTGSFGIVEMLSGDDNDR
jgi:hypothetical protein